MHGIHNVYKELEMTCHSEEFNWSSLRVNKQFSDNNNLINNEIVTVKVVH